VTRRARSWLAVWAILGGGCASLPTLTERPEDYALYRAARVAPTLEERLRAADRYLREVPGGPHVKQLRSWFVREEEKYYLEAFNRLSALYAYRAALPDGPHIGEVESRIESLEARRVMRRQKISEEDQAIAEGQARLKRADAERRALVTTFKDWTARLTSIRSFGEPTSELDDEAIFAFRLSDPRGACQGDRCTKLLELRYRVPGERQLLERVALLEVQLDLERGLLARAALAGPELWTRLGEALSMRPLPSPTPEDRADAVHRSALLVSSLLEAAFPAASCAVVAGGEAVLERACRGRRVRMVAGKTGADDDFLEIAPALAIVPALKATATPSP
jgi:uncharacterized coiled-coil protein SlyX